MVIPSTYRMDAGELGDILLLGGGERRHLTGEASSDQDLEKVSAL